MEYLFIVLVSVLAGMATYYVSVKLNKGAVFGSAVVTLISGILFPHFIPTIGSRLAIVATCASYAGMVGIKNAPRISEMAVIGLINGIIFIATLSAYPGVGGRLGTIAAISCFVWIGLKKGYSLIKENKSNSQLDKNPAH